MEFMARGRQWRVCIAAGRVCPDRLKQIHYKRTAQRGKATQRPADLIGRSKDAGKLMAPESAPWMSAFPFGAQAATLKAMAIRGSPSESIVAP